MQHFCVQTDERNITQYIQLIHWFIQYQRQTDIMRIFSVYELNSPFSFRSICRRCRFIIVIHTIFKYHPQNENEKWKQWHMNIV